MKAVQRSIRAGHRPVPEARIMIIGSNDLQNFLLGTFIEEKTGVVCRCGSDITIRPGEKRGLVLYDCFSVDYAHLWILTESFLSHNSDHCYLSLFNVDSDAGLEENAVARGIRGVFYRSEHPEILSKGVEAILNGELWYSRKITERLILNNDRNSKVLHMARVGLTTREKEILFVIAAGSSNNVIADKFNISAHTVKNHIYNIYRKINVKSRLEAILWVTKYL